jgi:GT2 family glycosyltransferase/glycosyltransferase involved in cell wall biosynthesis
MNAGFFNQVHLALLNKLAKYKKYKILRRWYFRYSGRLLRASGLFDEAFYLAENSDVAENGMDPIRHYLLCGDKEGRMPNPFFDPSHYRKSLKRRLPLRKNAFLHYILVGRHSRHELSPLLDTRHFYETNRDLKLQRVEPLAHLRDRNVANRHYSPFGSGELLRTHLCVEPDAQVWERLARSTNQPDHGPEPLLDVILPVYRGAAETLRCIEHVLRFPQRTPFELIVINDSSPDEALGATLRKLSRQGLFTLLENETNLGFVKTANRGMLLHPSRDVVLLNSDAEPHNDWLDRLRAAVFSSDDIGTATPLSNNATICSYPLFNKDNPWPLELNPSELDLIAAEVNSGVTVDLPTGVGFCFFIRRACLKDVGGFDEKAFGHGYGEENDLCQRARQAGWRSVLAGDVYVWHWGASSFRGTKARHLARAMKALERRHPDYHRGIQAFIKADPALPVRMALDRARLMRHASHAGNILAVMHGRGGGAARFLREEFARVADQGGTGFLLVPTTDKIHGRLSMLGMPRLPNLAALDLLQPDVWDELVSSLRLREIHIHQLVDFPDTLAEMLPQVFARHCVPYDCFVHDYHAICPRINLVGPAKVYCGEPGVQGCAKCLSRQIKGLENPEPVSIEEWRHRHGRFLQQARRVVVPDEDVAARLARYHPDAHYIVRPHEDSGRFPTSIRIREKEKDKPFRICVIGAISLIKGFEVLHSCAQAARRRGLPLEFLLYGFSCHDSLLEKAGVKVLGRYRDDLAANDLRSLDPDLAWIPSLWPETYSYTLSLALEVGIPTIAFDLGAQASRLRRLGMEDLLIPLGMAKQPDLLNRRLLAICKKRSEIDRSTAADPKLVAA